VTREIPAAPPLRAAEIPHALHRVYRTGKRDSETTDLFIRDLRERVLGTPEISTDGFHPYRPAIRHAFGERVAHGVISKTYSVTDLRKDAAHRQSAMAFGDELTKQPAAHLTQPNHCDAGPKPQ
jgi:transposase-like protein